MDFKNRDKWVRLSIKNSSVEPYNQKLSKDVFDNWFVITSADEELGFYDGKEYFYLLSDKNINNVKEEIKLTLEFINNDIVYRTSNYIGSSMSYKIAVNHIRIDEYGFTVYNGLNTKIVSIQRISIINNGKNIDGDYIRILDDYSEPFSSEIIISEKEFNKELNIIDTDSNFEKGLKIAKALNKNRIIHSGCFYGLLNYKGIKFSLVDTDFNYKNKIYKTKSLSEEEYSQFFDKNII